jgi:hypothetical protein
MAVVACCFAGCGEKSSADKGAEAVKAVKAPESPEKVVLEVVAAVKAGELVKVYAMLPDSYQKDVQAVFDKVAAKMDKEIYEKAFGLLPKALEVVKANKDKMPVPPEMLATAEEVLKILTAAKLNTYDGFKALNIAGFLADNGKAIADLAWKGASMDGKNPEELKKMLDTVKAELKDPKATGDTLVVVVTVGENKEEMEFKKVEGKWIPTELANGWAKGKEEAMKNVDGAMAEFEKNKEQIKGMLTGVEAALAKNDPSALMGLMMMGAMGGGGAPAPEVAPAPEAAPAPAPAQ